jgi:hypothetical protein
VADVDWDAFYDLPGNVLNISVMSMGWTRVGTNIRVVQWVVNRCLAEPGAGLRAFWGRRRDGVGFRRVGSKAGVELWEPRGTWYPDWSSGFSGGPWPVYSLFGTVSPSSPSRFFEDTYVALGAPDEAGYYLLHPPRLWWRFCESVPHAEGDPEGSGCGDIEARSLPEDFECH